MTSYRRTRLVLATLASAACAAAGAGTGGPADGPAIERGDDVAAALGGRAVSLAPATQRFAYRRRDSVLLQLPGGAEQASAGERTAFLSVTLAPAGDALRATIRIDSVASPDGQALPGDTLQGAAGLTFTGLLTREGALGPLAASRRTELGDRIAGELPWLWPRLPAGGARAGASWSDSVATTIATGGSRERERAAVAYDADRDGRLLAIDGRAEWARTGTSEQDGQRYELEASGVRTLRWTLDGDGHLRGLEARDSGAMRITATAAGQSVPAAQRTTLTLVPIDD